MPLFFLFVGIMLVVVGINDRASDLITLLKDDLEPSDGSPSFIVWILAVGVIALLGNVKSLKPVSNGFLVLLVLVFLLANKGFINQFLQDIGQQNTTVSNTVLTQV